MGVGILSEQGKLFLTTLCGGSMLPTLRNKDKVMLKRVALGDLGNGGYFGDIIDNRDR